MNQTCRWLLLAGGLHDPLVTLSSYVGTALSRRNTSEWGLIHSLVNWTQKNNPAPRCLMDLCLLYELHQAKMCLQGMQEQQRLRSDYQNHGILLNVSMESKSPHETLRICRIMSIWTFYACSKAFFCLTWPMDLRYHIYLKYLGNRNSLLHFSQNLNKSILLVTFLLTEWQTV